MNPIFFISDEKASHSNPGKTGQGMTRRGKARRGEARRGKTRRRPDKKVSPGFENTVDYLRQHTTQIGDSTRRISGFK